MNAPTGGKAATPAVADFIALSEEIAALVRARIPLQPHLAQLGQELPGKTGELAGQIGRRLEAGESLAAALDAECPSLPATYRAAIAAGVESGQLGAALESIADSASRLDQLRRVTGVAIIYPLILVVVVCWLLPLMLISLVPGFQWAGQFHYGPIAWLAHWPYTAPVLMYGVPGLVLIVVAAWWWRSGRLGGARTTRFGWLAWLPGARGVQRWSQAATFAEMLLLLVQRGVPLDQSLRLAGESTDDARLRRAALRLADEARSGETVGATGRRDAAARPGDMPLLVRLALYHAGDRALMSASLRQAADMYRERAVRAADWHAEYLPILLTVAVGGTLTVAFTLLVFWPYTSMLHTLAQWNWR